MRLGRIESGLAVGLSMIALTGCGAKGRIALNGCNLKQSTAELKAAIRKPEQLAGDVITNQEGDPVRTYITNGKVNIFNPIVLVCGENVVAFAGVHHPHKLAKDPSYNPVEIIDQDDPNAQLFSLDGSQIVISPANLHLENDSTEIAGAGLQDMLGFTDSDHSSDYGVVINGLTLGIPPQGFAPSLPTPGSVS